MTDSTEYRTIRRTVVQRRSIPAKSAKAREAAAPASAFDILGDHDSETVIVDACVPRRLAEIMRTLYENWRAGSVKI